MSFLAQLMLVRTVKMFKSDVWSAPPPFRVYTFMQCICYKKIKENGEARLVKQCLYYYLHGIASCSHRAVRELTIVIENEKKMNLHI